jgi:hypothetical protein
MVGVGGGIDEKLPSSGNATRRSHPREPPPAAAALLAFPAVVTVLTGVTFAVLVAIDTTALPDGGLGASHQLRMLGGWLFVAAGILVPIAIATYRMNRPEGYLGRARTAEQQGQPSQEVLTAYRLLVVVAAVLMILATITGLAILADAVPTLS